MRPSLRELVLRDGVAFSAQTRSLEPPGRQSAVGTSPMYPSASALGARGFTPESRRDDPSVATPLR
jgi:hypothetical protein